MFDDKNTVSKIEREREALRKIALRFPNFKNLTDIIEDYERKEDEESKIENKIYYAAGGIGMVLIIVNLFLAWRG